MSSIRSQHPSIIWRGDRRHHITMPIETQWWIHPKVTLYRIGLGPCPWFHRGAGFEKFTTREKQKSKQKIVKQEVTIGTWNYACWRKTERARIRDAKVQIEHIGYCWTVTVQYWRIGGRWMSLGLMERKWNKTRRKCQIYGTQGLCDISNGMWTNLKQNHKN